MRTSQPPANGQSPPRPDTDGEGGPQGGDRATAPSGTASWTGWCLVGVWEWEDIAGLPWAVCSQGELGLGRRCRSGGILPAEARPRYSRAPGCSGLAPPSLREVLEGGWAAEAGVQVSEDPCSEVVLAGPAL